MSSLPLFNVNTVLPRSFAPTLAPYFASLILMPFNVQTY